MILSGASACGMRLDKTCELHNILIPAVGRCTNLFYSNAAQTVFNICHVNEWAPQLFKC